MGQGGVPGIAGGSLEDRYFLQKVKLGEGSFGTVWRAVDRQTNEVVAIKQLDKASLPRRGVRRSDIEREVAMMQACHHANITKLFGTFEDEARIYLALEYCDGGDFGDKVKERGLALQESETAEWMRQICSAISALHHKSICHRDIKPDNFMVSGHGSGSQLKLSDFGLAVYLPRGRVLHERCGTPAFMAPEQHELPRHSSGYGFPADVWAAGVLMYMVMFGGRHPFLGDRGQLDEKALIQGALDFREGAQNRIFGFDIGPTSLRFSDAARDLCSRMVCPDPGQRYKADDCLRVPWMCLGRAAGQAKASGAPGGSGRGTPPERPPSPTGQRSQRPVIVHQPGPPAPPPPPPMAPQAHANGPPSGREGGSAHVPVPFPMPREQQPMQLRDLQRSRTKKFSDMSDDQRRQHGQPKNARAGTLPAGTKCRYESASYGWVETVVQRCNDDGTYDLEHKQGAQPDKIAPTKACSLAEAWPVGSLAMYHSSTINRWLPTVVTLFDERTKTYNLEVRDHADVDRIRAGRFPPSAGGSQVDDQGIRTPCLPPHAPALVATPSGGSSAAVSAMVSAAYPGPPSDRPTGPMVSVGYPCQQQGDRTGSKEVRDGSAEAPLNLHDLKCQPASWHGEGMVCMTADHGLVKIEQYSPADNSFTVHIVGSKPEQRVQVQERRLRAPGELPYAWAGNTKVWYDSPSTGTKIPAVVMSFNEKLGKYNLDVRENAAPDRVRPRFPEQIVQ